MASSRPFGGAAVRSEGWPRIEALIFRLGVSGVERYVERSLVALPVLAQWDQQLVSATLEDAVVAVSQVALPLLGVQTLRLDLVGEGVVEVELRGELVTLFR